MSARLVWTFAAKVTGVFWSVVSVAGLAETWSTLAALPSSVDRIGAVAVGRDGDRPGVAVQRGRWRIERVAADGDVAAAGPEVDGAVASR